MISKIFSKFGLSLASFYWLVTIGVIVYSNACSGMFCGLVIVIPVLPWPLINPIEHFITDSWLTYLIIVMLNSALIYFIGAAIQGAIGKIKARIK